MHRKFTGIPSVHQDSLDSIGRNRAFDEAAQAFIYALVDPTTLDYRYIGKTSNPTARLSGHRSKATHSDGGLSLWFRSHLGPYPHRDAGPLMVILERVPRGIDWKWRERRWIALGREQGWPLFNRGSGGEGLVGPSFEERRKAVIARKATVGTPEWHADLYARRPRGSSHPFSDTNEAQVVQILELAKLGWKTADIANELWVSANIVNSVRHGHSWKHVPRL